MKIRNLQDTFVINLTQGKQALVDEKDWYELNKHKWCAVWDKGTQSYYATRGVPHPEGGKYKNGKPRFIQESMHRYIMRLEFKDKKQVDHVNHNTLDNRRENLWVTTNRGNHHNRKNQSQYGVGVTYMRARAHLPTPYKAQAHLKGRMHYIGYYATPEEAQEAQRRWLKDKGIFVPQP